MSIKTRVDKLESRSPQKPHKAVLIVNHDNRPLDEAIARHMPKYPGDEDADMRLIVNSVG